MASHAPWLRAMLLHSFCFFDRDPALRNWVPPIREKTLKTTVCHGGETGAKKNCLEIDKNLTWSRFAASGPPAGDATDGCRSFRHKWRGVAVFCGVGYRGGAGRCKLKLGRGSGLRIVGERS